MRTLLGILATSAGVAWASPFAYVANVTSGDVSIIDTASGTVTATVTLGAGSTPLGVAVTPDGQRVYVVTASDDMLWELDASGTVLNSTSVSSHPTAVVYDAATDRVYVASSFFDMVTVLNGTTLATLATLSVGTNPLALVLNPGSATYRVFVANWGDDTVSAISTTNAVSSTIPVGSGPNGLGIDNVHGVVYVANMLDDSVTLIDGSTATVSTTLALPPGSSPSDVVVDHSGTHWYVAACCKVLGFLAGTLTPTLTHTVADTAWGIDIDPSDSTLYVTDPDIDAVDVIPIASPSSATTISVGTYPLMQGRFIGPGTPGVPTAVSATAGNAQAVVAFSAPAFDGGTAVTQYHATCGSQSASGAGSPLTVTGLTNGVTVACTVAAVNAMGTGPASAPLDVTPATVPGAPTAASATAGNAQVTVAFTAPASNGGSAILSYTATCGTRSVSGSGAPIVVAPLTNGVPVTCTVTATNAVGTGPASAPTSSVTPAAPLTAPGAPTGVSAIPGSGQATVSFTAPSSDGGSPILSYTATCGAGSASGPASPLVVTGLANGVAVTCTVTATNAVGTSVASAPPVGVTPAGVPGAPTGAIASPGSGDVTVTFTAPASNGGSPITSYTATCGARSASGTSTHITVGGLANGVGVTCTVVATNAIGTGPPSIASSSVTPAPKSFTGPVATGAGLATVTLFGGGAACNFAPQGTGVLQSAFFIPVEGSPKSPPAGTAPVTFAFGLLDFVLLACDPGSMVTMAIQFPGPVPSGAVYWKYGPTASQPAPHWYVLPATISGNTVTFSITDGGLGDDDLAANGTVVDQGGPGGGGAPTPVPALDGAMLAVLTLLIAMSGSAFRRRGR